MFSYKAVIEVAFEFFIEKSKTKPPLWSDSFEFSGSKFNVSAAPENGNPKTFLLRLSLVSSDQPVFVTVLAEIPDEPGSRQIVRFELTPTRGWSPYQIEMPRPKDKDVRGTMRIRIDGDPGMARSLYFRPHAEAPKPGAGICRAGMNTCYMIAGLRLLYSTVGFRRFVIRACEGSEYDERPVLFALRDLFARLDEQEDVWLWPLLDAMVFPVFNVMEEQDVQEFLERILDCVKLEVEDNEEFTREIDEMFRCETVNEDGSISPWKMGLGHCHCSWSDFPDSKAHPNCKVVKAPEILVLSLGIGRHDRIPMSFDGIAFYNRKSAHYTAKVRLGSRWFYWDDRSGREQDVGNHGNPDPRILWYVRHDKVEDIMVGGVPHVEIVRYARVLREEKARKAVEVGAAINLWSPFFEFERAEAGDNGWLVKRSQKNRHFEGDSFGFKPERQDQEQPKPGCKLVQYASWDPTTGLSEPSVCLCSDIEKKPEKGRLQVIKTCDHRTGQWRDLDLCRDRLISDQTLVIECQDENLKKSLEKSLQESLQQFGHFSTFVVNNVSCKPLGKDSHQRMTLSNRKINPKGLKTIISRDSEHSAESCQAKEPQFFRVFSHPGLPDYVSTCLWRERHMHGLATNSLPGSKEWAFAYTESAQSIRVVIEETTNERPAVYSIDDSDSLTIAQVRRKFGIPASASALRIKSDGRMQRIDSILDDSDVVSKSREKEEILFAAIPCRDLTKGIHGRDLTKFQPVIFAVPVPGNKNGVMQFGRPFLVSLEENADTIYQVLESRKPNKQESELYFCLGTRKYKPITPALIGEFIERRSPKLAKATWAIVTPMEWPQVACDMQGYFKDRFTYADFC